MTLCVLLRAYIVFYKNKHSSQSIEQKIINLNWAVFSVTACWGLGWLIVVPELPFNLQCLYLLMSSTAIFVGLYGYSINRATILCFAAPIFICQFIITSIPPFIFPWPIILGELAFSLYTLKMASYFSKSWTNTVTLQIQNQMLNQALEMERNTAIASNVSKSKFIATASHDLRQPLHAVNIYLDLFDPNSLPPKEKINFFQIRKSVQTLNSMFKSLLDLSKLDAGTAKKIHKLFELIELVGLLSDTFTPIATGKNISLQIDFMNVLVDGDKVLLQQLIGNLVSNAIQYTATGSVSITLTSHEGYLQISIKDTGCGIDSSVLDKIFDEFYRVDGTRSMHDGLGLGLSIVKRLCKISDSEITITSTLGEGTSCVVQTKYATQALPEYDAPHPSKDKGGSTSGQQSLLSTKTIAIFEDDQTIFEAYKKALSENGFHVLSLPENSQDLMRGLAGINHIDCILSDYRLATTTGDLIIQQLRDSFGTDIPALIITADTSPQHIQLFKELNIEVLYKPIGYSEIVSAIKNLLFK
jgi:signal transduction histidine kinase